MANVTLDIPDELLAKLKNGGTEVGAALRLAAAFSLCSRGQLSTSQAARLAGMTYADFLAAAAGAEIELFPVHTEELTEEVRCGFTLGRQRVADHPRLVRSPDLSVARVYAAGLEATCGKLVQFLRRQRPRP